MLDVRRAYFYARALRPIYIEIPAEDFRVGDGGLAARLEMSLCVTRDAGLNWSREVEAFMKQAGLQKGKASSCNFRHKA